MTVKWPKRTLLFGSLLETQFGEAIDKHDAVIRFNAAVTEGFEQFVAGLCVQVESSLPKALESAWFQQPLSL